MSPRLLLLVVVALACASCKKDDAKAPPTATPAPAATGAAAPSPAATTAAAPAAPAARDRVFTQEELAQMVAPIALYPDPLLAQVLMAATYPGDVADAAAWSKEHPDAKGDDAVKLVADEPWDPSVQSLVAFPQALSTLGQDPAWVQRLGDAFLAQPDNVMDAVQQLRRKAKDAGNLATNEYQKISTQPAPPPSEPAPVYDDSGSGAMVAAAPAASTDVIVIESADPQTVYVPAYNPTTVYGTWSYPSYPPPYYPPPSYYYPGSALARGLAWGTGVAIADSLWGDMDWNDHDVDINVNSYNSINTNRQINASNRNWQHNSLNRDGVPYRDQVNRDRHANRLPDSASRDHMRGDDARRAQARQSMERRGMEAPARTNREAQQRAQTARREVEQRGGADAARRGGDAARQHAGAGANRDAARQHAGAAGNRDAARERAAASAQRAGGADRANAANRQQHAGNRSAQNRQPQQHRQQGANNHASRDAARQQMSHQQRPHNDAFAGARSPQQSHAASQRGRASQAQARQGGGGNRQASHQVNRQPRGGGGGQQRQAAQRAPSGGHAGGGRRR
ncbi:putative exported protein [Lysobacter dokdonensis DS-58]|uniref:Putative exported protein n=1 Tax=Lysobacter dokdonensis DS-58 TaxID=1300345 RepID=A0A0A2X254_9GAMM|nr:DUF3300 domain-containing protein [Lysobacter dokdonensis]KGQ19309.1 putative exported protein [Lysobacter dokdonensis DS-58]